MKRSTACATVAAVAGLVPGVACADTAAFTDPLGDARRVQQGSVTEGATGDSDITGISVRWVHPDGEGNEIRVRIQVREIDRSSDADGARSGVGLATRAVLRLDTGMTITVEGQPRGYSYAYTGGEFSCFDPEDELAPIPDLRYGRYTDTITVVAGNGCIENAGTVEVAVSTRLYRKNSRLVDRAETEPVTIDRGDTTGAPRPSFR